MIFIGIIIGMICFCFFGEGLNKMDIKGLEFLQKKTRELLKKKMLYQYSTFGILAIIALFVTVRINIGGFLQGFLLGAIWSVVELIFEDNLFDKLRNNLR